MTLQQLEYIVNLDNERHFVRAAERCFVTQPTLTMGIKKLEEELGTILFDRKKHPVEPTKSGARVIEKSRQILREANQLRQLVKGEKESLEGTFRVGVIPTLAPYLMPLFLGEFIQKNPNTNLIIEEIQSHQIIEMLKNDTLDVGLLVTPLEEQQLREIPLFEEPFLVYSSEKHPLYKKSEIETSDITEDGMWLLNQGHCFRNQALNICGIESRSQNVFTYESGSIETLKRMVDKNFGYTLVPELSVIDEEDNPRVKRFTKPEPVREVSLVVHNSFSREGLIDKLKKAILEKVPENIQKAEPHIRVEWR
ncbi:LysR substrate-binding domain-containing protein [Halocola ammonii]